LKIGAPSEWRDYGGLTIKPDDLMGNIRRGERFLSDDRMTRVRDRGSRLWLMTPQTVNAYYSPGANEIVLPAAILQPPLFESDVDMAVNYGRVGAFVSHELMHAVDLDLGLRRRARPLVDQYDAYSPAPGLHVSGELTLRENTGDLGGVEIAYRAYNASLDGHDAPVVDGFTGEQRFFMGWAQLWRAKIRDEYLRRWVTSIAHAPPEYRADGSVTNLQEFYDAFHVQPGDKLYRDPSRRVVIW
jgi:predicted metalloendopeptidase